MDLFEAADLKPIPVLDSPSVDQFKKDVSTKRQSVIIKGVADSWPFVKKWTLDYLEQKVARVKVQEKSEDGIYHFLRYKEIPFQTFRESLSTTKGMYLSPDPILGKGGKPIEDGELALLAKDLPTPEFTSKRAISAANLWIGPGSNSTVVHYDAWDSFLVPVSGTKRFAVFNGEQTQHLFPYGILDFGALADGRTMDSKVNPLAIQDEYVDQVRKTTGVHGNIGHGDILFIPAGHWHFVRSESINIAVNFFSTAPFTADRFRSPLRQYFLKTQFVEPPTRHVWRSVRFFGRTSRRIARR